MLLGVTCGIKSNQRTIPTHEHTYPPHLSSSSSSLPEEVIENGRSNGRRWTSCRVDGWYSEHLLDKSTVLCFVILSSWEQSTVACAGSMRKEANQQDNWSKFEKLCDLTLLETAFCRNCTGLWLFFYSQLNSQSRNSTSDFFVWDAVILATIDIISSVCFWRISLKSSPNILRVHFRPLSGITL